MDNRKHKIYFAMGIDKERRLFYKYGQTIAEVEKRFDQYYNTTERTLFLLSYYELEIPEDPEDRWAQADIAENALARALRQVLIGFTRIGERFYPSEDAICRSADNHIRLTDWQKDLIKEIFENALRKNNIKFKKGEVW